ncbi:MAG: hypothetical protein ACJATI_001477 [Halioglobus sp.]|jgi:hypothetical protein
MLSRISCIAILTIYVIVRFLSLDFDQPEKNMFTDSDGLGYYIYLPAIFIYADITKYEWLPEIHEKYNVYGGEEPFQIGKHKNGNYVTNYLGGVAVLQLPFFTAGHLVSKMTDYPSDGFSPPYQFAIGIAPIFYLVLCLFLLRKVLLTYYDDTTVAVTLALVLLATNAVEYIAIEAGQSHGYVLPLYALVLYLSMLWHNKPSGKIAFALGATIGLATIMRPTELIMVLIPILWNTHNKEEKSKKWALVRSNRSHLIYAFLGGVLGGGLQVVYWLYVTGNFIQTVGSKWRFLDPYWRVLVGWEKGWFIYTPITIFFVVGLFFLKNRPFKKSVVWFCVINIWIIISWNNWRYGGSYSTRALVQSYPVFAFAFAGFVSWVLSKKWKYLFLGFGLYLIGVNLFQVWQYRQNIIHYDDMNRAYYKAVYLDKNPTPLDMSLMNGGQVLSSSMDQQKVLFSIDSETEVNGKEILWQYTIPEYHSNTNGGLEVHLDLLVKQGYWSGKIYVRFSNRGEEVSLYTFRTFHAMTEYQKRNKYVMQLVVPRRADKVEIGFLGDGFQGIVFEGEVLEILD